MKCPECGEKLIDIRTMAEDADHLLCVGCGKEFSTVPDEDEQIPGVEMAEDFPVFLL